MTGEINKLNNFNFYEKDEELWYYDSQLEDYVRWEDFKLKFKINNINFKLPKNFKIFTTFRTQDSEDWSGAKAAFEQNLVDNKIEWFVYIKFYIDLNEEIKPLVIGKSGSLLVNSSGSDLSFSINIEDGPARRFLNENNFEWCKTQIAIYKCDSEREALDLEKEMQLKYNLFGS